MEIATREAVREAAEKIMQTTKKSASEVKAAEVREVIKGGSFSTINKRLAEWRAEREEKALFRSAIPDMPDEVRGLWERVWQIADAQHHEVRDAWAQEKKGLTRDIEERDTEIARLEDEVSKIQAEFETMNRQVKEAHEALAAAENERALAIARAETASEQQDRIIEKLTARLEPYLSAKESDPNLPQTTETRKEA
jgi:chromosome segregation ATPase